MEGNGRGRGRGGNSRRRGGWSEVQPEVATARPPPSSGLPKSILSSLDQLQINQRRLEQPPFETTIARVVLQHDLGGVVMSFFLPEDGPTERAVLLSTLNLREVSKQTQSFVDRFLIEVGCGSALVIEGYGCRQILEVPTYPWKELFENLILGGARVVEEEADSVQGGCLSPETKQLLLQHWHHTFQSCSQHYLQHLRHQGIDVPSSQKISFGGFTLRSSFQYRIDSTMQEDCEYLDDPSDPELAVFSLEAYPYRHPRILQLLLEDFARSNVNPLKRFDLSCDHFRRPDILNDMLKEPSLSLIRQVKTMRLDVALHSSLYNRCYSQSSAQLGDFGAPAGNSALVLRLFKNLYDLERLSLNFQNPENGSAFEWFEVLQKTVVSQLRVLDMTWIEASNPRLKSTSDLMRSFFSSLRNVQVLRLEEFDLDNQFALMLHEGSPNLKRLTVGRIGLNAIQDLLRGPTSDHQRPSRLLQLAAQVVPILSSEKIEMFAKLEDYIELCNLLGCGLCPDLELMPKMTIANIHKCRAVSELSELDAAQKQLVTGCPKLTKLEVFFTSVNMLNHVLQVLSQNRQSESAKIALKLNLPSFDRLVLPPSGKTFDESFGDMQLSIAKVIADNCALFHTLKINGFWFHSQRHVSLLTDSFLCSLTNCSNDTGLFVNLEKFYLDDHREANSYSLEGLILFASTLARKWKSRSVCPNSPIRIRAFGGAQREDFSAPFKLLSSCDAVVKVRKSEGGVGVFFEDGESGVVPDISAWSLPQIEEVCWSTAALPLGQTLIDGIDVALLQKGEYGEQAEIL